MITLTVLYGYNRKKSLEKDSIVAPLLDWFSISFIPTTQKEERLRERIGRGMAESADSGGGEGRGMRISIFQYSFNGCSFIFRLCNLASIAKRSPGAS
jgi:hypothetical protein